MLALGFHNICSHDPGAALVEYSKDSIKYITAEDGFLSRKKKSYNFPLRAIKYCLDYFGAKIDDIDTVGLDIIDQRNSFKTSSNYRHLAGDFVKSRLKISPSKISYYDHHYAHAISAFYASGFDDTAVLVVDGLGTRQQTHSIFKCSKSKGIHKVFEQQGAGIGLLYTLVTSKILGFKPGEEGKTMGLAPYGHQLDELDVHLPSFKGLYSKGYTDYSAVVRRAPSHLLRISHRVRSNNDDIYDPYFTRVAYNIQKEAERCLEYLSKFSCQLTGCSNLCFTGGVALNCVANNILQSKDYIDNFFVYPAASDIGIPLGLALSAAESFSGTFSKVIQDQLYTLLKVPYSQDVSPLNHIVAPVMAEIMNYIPTSRKFSPELIVEHLVKGNVVAFFSDGIEHGPRALGHRSFLADPRRSDVKDTLNKKIKHREAYRPFAPMILKEYFSDWFESETDDHPYMLQAPKATFACQEQAPGIVHIDKTSRVQTVTKSSGRVYEILLKFMDTTGVPILVNTSFNDNNEPIVFTDLDAVICFLHCEADVLVLNDTVIERSELSNVHSLYSIAITSRADLMSTYYDSCLENLTTISDTSGLDLRSFFAFSQALTSSNRDTRLWQQLIDLLGSDEYSSYTLVTDDYHYRLLIKLDKILGGFNHIHAREIVIVQDEFSSHNQIPPNSIILLYNLSAYYRDNSFQKEIYRDITSLNSGCKIPDNSVSFYSIADRCLEIDYLIGLVEHNNNLTAYDLFHSSNDYNSANSPDHFLKSLLKDDMPYQVHHGIK